MRLTHTHAIRVIDATSEVVDNPLVLKLARGMGCGSASMTALRFLFRIILITVAFAMMLAGGLFIAMSTIDSPTYAWRVLVHGDFEHRRLRHFPQSGDCQG